MNSKRIALGTLVVIATPQGSVFDGKTGRVSKHLDGDAYAVRIGGTDLMFSANEVKVSK